MDGAKDIFERLLSGGYEAIKALKEEKVPEHQLLEYKLKAGPEEGKPSDKDCLNLAKEISAFGNSDGGVIVWGIHCKEVKTGDVPTKLSPIKSINGFKSRIENRLASLTVPPPSGIRNEIILSPKKKDIGFLLTYVPKADLVPIRSLRSDHYYLRSGSACVRMPHGVLETMFGKRPSPTFDLSYRPGSGTFDDMETLKFRRKFSVSNPGSVIVRDVFFTLELASTIGPNSKIVFGLAARHVGSQSSTDEHRISIVTTGDFKLAPMNVLDMYEMSIVLKEPIETDLRIFVTYGCDGSAVRTFEYFKPMGFFQQVFQFAFGGLNRRTWTRQHFSYQKDLKKEGVQKAGEDAFDTTIDIPLLT